MKPVDPRIDPRLVPPCSKAIVVAEHQDEYIDLPSIRTPNIACIVNGKEAVKAGYTITRWELTPEERTLIASGEDVYITLVSLGSINPLFATVGPVDWNK
jgi:hypothetical protein